MKRWKQLLSVVAMLIVVSTISCGAASSSVPELSLEECIRLVLQGHPQLRMAEFHVKDAEVELQKLRLEEPGLVAPRELAEKEGAVEEARWALDEAGMRLSLEVESKYYQVLKAIHTVKSRENSLDWIQRQLEIVKIKCQKGLVPQKDLLTMQDQLAQAEKDLKYARFTLETVKMDFNLTMGWELTRTFELAEKQFPFESVEVNLEEAIQYALGHGTEILQAEKLVGAAAAALELKRLSGLGRLDVEQAERAVEKAKIQLDTARKGLTIGVRNAYVSLLTGRDQVLTARKTFEQAQKSLEVLKVKYEAGMVPLLDLTNAHHELMDTEVQWIQAIYDYNLTKAAFYQTIGKGYSRYLQLKATIGKG